MEAVGVSHFIEWVCLTFYYYLWAGTHYAFVLTSKPVVTARVERGGFNFESTFVPISCASDTDTFKQEA